MRLSTPCSRMRSSAGEISSAAFGLFLSLALSLSSGPEPSGADGCWTATAKAGRASPPHATDVWRRKFRRVVDDNSMVVLLNCVSLDCIRMACLDEGCKTLRCRIDAEHFDKLGDLAQVAESIARGLVVTAKEIDIEDVLPGTSTHGARFDLAQADVAQGEDAEGFEKRAGQVF